MPIGYSKQGDHPYQEQFDRMLRCFNKITQLIDGNGDQDVYNDDLYSFFKEAWHLKDWIKNDSTINPVDIETIAKEYDVLMVCADIANRSKHLFLERKRVDADHSKTDVTVTLPTIIFNLPESGEIPVLFGKGGNTFSYKYWFKDNTGKEYEAYSLAQDIIRAWESIIDKYINYAK